MSKFQSTGGAVETTCPICLSMAEAAQENFSPIAIQYMGCSSVEDLAAAFHSTGICTCDDPAAAWF